MFCPKCGKETDALGKFCQWCGEDIVVVPATVDAAAPEEEEGVPELAEASSPSTRF